MTTFKVWGRRLPGGIAEVDREDMDHEREVFSVFPDDFSTYRDAGKMTIGPEQRRELDAAYEKMLARAAAMKQAMLSNHQEVDLDLIAKTVFGHIPPGLIPPQFVKELQDWRRVRDAMTARAVVKGQAPEGRADKIKGGLDKADLAAKLTSGALGAIPGLKDTEAGEIIKNINDALKGMAQALEAIGLGFDGAQALGDQAEALATASPVALKIADEKMMAALKSLGGLGADVLAKFIPVVGTMKSGAECVAAIKDTMERTKLRASSGELRDKAQLDTASQLGRAFDQAQGRETRLAVGSGIDATTSGLSTAASVATATVIGAKVGAAIEVASGVIKVGGAVVLAGFDEAGARTAVKTLRAAQAGDTEAQQEVFSKHAHYAKMLIAVLAMDKNPLARTYLIDRGLEESDFNNPLTTADLLFDYAVLKSDETAAPVSKVDQAIAAAQAAGETLATVGTYLRGKLEKLGVLTAKPAEPVPEIVVLYEAPAVRKMIADIRTLKATVQDPANQPAPTADQTAFKALVSKVTAMNLELATLQITLNKVVNDTIDMAAAAEAAAKTGGAYRGLTGVPLVTLALSLRADEARWQSALDEIARR
jgi:hypothetical protein